MTSPSRHWFLVPALVVIVFLYWGLDQADSRAIYASWDKLLHASVFFLVWWLLRWSLPVSGWWVSALLIVAGLAEEGVQMYQPGHQADLLDWAADVVGVALATTIDVVGRMLWLLRASVQTREASGDIPLTDAQAMVSWGRHRLHWRLTLKLWRWEFYLVVLGGRERRALTAREQDVARWTVWFLIIVFAIASIAVGAVVVMLIKTALGW